MDVDGVLVRRAQPVSLITEKNNVLSIESTVHGGQLPATRCQGRVRELLI